MSMAKKKKRKPRFPSKLASDAYRYLLEEEEDKKDYILDRFTYAYVYVTYYDCYIYVHCQLYHDDPGAEHKLTFCCNGESKVRDYHFIKEKLFGGDAKPEDE
jgi:hypothetical protein